MLPKTKKKCSGDMVDRYLSVKFSVNPLHGFRENDVYGRTDGRPRHDSSAKQSQKLQLLPLHKLYNYCLDKYMYSHIYDMTPIIEILLNSDVRQHNNRITDKARVQFFRTKKCKKFC